MCGIRVARSAHILYLVTLGVIEIRDKRYKSLLCTTTSIWSDSYTQTNYEISMLNSLKPSPPAFSIWNLKKLMKMTWLHMEFVLIFITGPSQYKLGRMARLAAADTRLARFRHPNWNLEFFFFKKVFPICSSRMELSVSHHCAFGVLV